MQPDKSNHLLSNALLIATAVVICALFVRKCHEDREIFDVEVVDEKAIDITPAQIRSIERIGEWEFLSIADEELIDTIRHRTLGRDDRLVRIYRGTLRLGVDLSKCEEGWVQVHGDTIEVALPPVGLLSERFIDEARTRAFFESGTWDARAKEQMYRKAARQMRRRCLTPSNIEQARENGREQMTALFRIFGFSAVEVKFK